MRVGAPSFEEVQRDWKQRGFSCGVWQDSPGQTWSDFIHSEDEMIILTKGKIEITIGTKKIQPAQGQEILIPKKSIHSVQNIGNEPNEWYFGYRLTKKSSDSFEND